MTIGRFCIGVIWWSRLLARNPDKKFKFLKGRGMGVGGAWVGLGLRLRVGILIGGGGWPDVQGKIVSGGFLTPRFGLNFEIILS
jgi:hypothetical protein